MKQEIKWQHGLPTEDGIYIITVCEDKVFTDTSYYNRGCGWEAYSDDKIIAWANVDDINPCTTRLYTVADFDNVLTSMITYLNDCDESSKKYYLANLSKSSLFEDAVGRVISANDEKGHVLVNEDF